MGLEFDDRLSAEAKAVTTVISIYCGLALMVVGYLGVLVNSITMPLDGPSGRRS